MAATLGSMPVLIARTGRSSSTASICATIMASETGSMACTPSDRNTASTPSPPDWRVLRDRWLATAEMEFIRTQRGPEFVAAQGRLLGATVAVEELLEEILEGRPGRQLGERELLPSPPLREQGYSSIGDWHTTLPITAGINEIVETLFIALALVVLVVFVFLKSMRATVIPILAIPVSVIGAFTVAYALGFTINILTLLALVLAIGLVVDDAIVVVERVMELMESEGLDQKSAAIKAMQQVSGAVIATTLVLLSIFVPIGFMAGITGKIYQQFAVSISAAVFFSTLNALTLSPALCATFLQVAKPKQQGPKHWFNTALNRVRGGSNGRGRPDAILRCIFYRRATRYRR